MAETYGLSGEVWNAAKEEIRGILVSCAASRSVIAYSELVRRVQAARLEAHDTRLFQLLGDISVDEDEAGRGMLSVLVVHKTGDYQPGPGFFELAKSLGRDTNDLLACWIQELKFVHTYWSGRRD